MRHYRKGFWMQPGKDYQCAFCGVKFGTSYVKFIRSCPSCHKEFFSFIELDKEIACFHRNEMVNEELCHFCKLRLEGLCEE